jgi:hypothetical protein
MAVTPALIDSGIKVAATLIDQLYTTQEEKDAAKLKLLELEFSGDLAQLEVNAKEATHSSLFVSGWRPGVGWVCLTAFAMNFVGLPVLESAVIYYSAFSGEYVDLGGLPEMDMSAMMPVLLGMLGLGGYRTYEKTRGVSR